jgi:hypothetical protein
MDKLLSANQRLQRFIDQLPSDVKSISHTAGGLQTSFLSLPTPGHASSSSSYASRSASPMQPMQLSHQQPQPYQPHPHHHPAYRSPVNEFRTTVTSTSESIQVGAAASYHAPTVGTTTSDGGVYTPVR